MIRSYQILLAYRPSTGHKDLPKFAGKAAEACNLFNLLKVAFCVYRQGRTPFSFQRKINAESYN